MSTLPGIHIIPSHLSTKQVQFPKGRRKLSLTHRTTTIVYLSTLKTNTTPHLSPHGGALQVPYSTTRIPCLRRRIHLEIRWNYITCPPENEVRGRYPLMGQQDWRKLFLGMHLAWCLWKTWCNHQPRQIPIFSRQSRICRIWDNEWHRETMQKIHQTHFKVPNPTKTNICKILVWVSEAGVIWLRWYSPSETYSKPTTNSRGTIHSNRRLKSQNRRWLPRSTAEWPYSTKPNQLVLLLIGQKMELATGFFKSTAHAHQTTSSAAKPVGT